MAAFDQFTYASNYIFSALDEAISDRSGSMARLAILLLRIWRATYTMKNSTPHGRAEERSKQDRRRIRIAFATVHRNRPAVVAMRGGTMYATVVTEIHTR